MPKPCKFVSCWVIVMNVKYDFCILFDNEYQLIWHNSSLKFSNWSVTLWPHSQNRNVIAYCQKDSVSAEMISIRLAEPNSPDYSKIIIIIISFSKIYSFWSENLWFCLKVHSTTEVCSTNNEQLMLKRIHTKNMVVTYS